MAKVANIIAIYTKTRNIILEFQSLGNTIELFLILFPTLRETLLTLLALVPPQEHGAALLPDGLPGSFFQRPVCHIDESCALPQDVDTQPVEPAASTPSTRTPPPVPFRLLQQCGKGIVLHCQMQITDSWLASDMFVVYSGTVRWPRRGGISRWGSFG
jgi:hypothetical protein